jgi:hypothetical protein
MDCLCPCRHQRKAAKTANIPAMDAGLIGNSQIQVSLNLQSRLGLAKVKYQYGQLHDLNLNPPLVSDKPSDSSLDFSRTGCETPFTSPCHRVTIYPKTLPRSAHSKHAVTYDCKVMQPILSVGRKRLRSDSGTESPAKVPGSLSKSSYQRPEPSLVVNQHLATRQSQVSFISDASVPNLSAPVYHGSSDEENEPDLPLYSFHSMRSIGDSFSAQNRPTKHARLSYNGRFAQHEDGADLRCVTNSPSGRVAASSPRQAVPPSTPPNKHLTPPSLSPNVTTHCQRFNFADFLNMTPSPARQV